MDISTLVFRSLMVHSFGDFMMTHVSFALSLRLYSNHGVILYAIDSDLHQICHDVIESTLVSKSVIIFIVWRLVYS